MATKSKSNAEARTIQRVFAIITAAVAAVALVFAGLAWWGGSYASNMVRDELSAQNITFPEEIKYPELQKFAGEPVDSGEKAKAYAAYIGHHLEEAADGKTYSEVSSEFQKDMTNTELGALRQQLFMGETLRGILLGTGFAYGLIGQIALTAAAVLLVVAVVAALSSVVLFQASRRK